MSDVQGGTQPNVALDLAQYDRIRKRIVEEDGLINHRMMWSTLAQTGLIAGFGFSTIENLSPLRVSVARAIVGAGMFVSFIAVLSVFAALSEIGRLNRLYAAPANGPLVGLGLKGSGWRHNAGHALAALLPPTMCILWLWAGWKLFSLSPSTALP